MLLERALRTLVRNGFNCIQIQVNFSDGGFTIGSKFKDVSEPESRIMVIVPETDGRALIVGRGNIKQLLEMLANRVARGTICNLTTVPVKDRDKTWRMLEFDRLYLYLGEDITKNSYPILSDKQEGFDYWLDCEAHDEPAEAGHSAGGE
jgi:hypothetical protein